MLSTFSETYDIYPQSKFNVLNRMSDVHYTLNVRQNVHNKQTEIAISLLLLKVCKKIEG